MHIELGIGTLFNHIVQRAYQIRIQQSEIEHALGQHPDRGIVRVGEAAAFAGGGDGGLLAGQYQVVKRPLRCAESPIGRKSAGDVAGIAIEFTAGIHQHLFARVHRRSAGLVMQHTGIGARRDDGSVRRKLRAVSTKLMQHLGFKVVLAHIFSSPQHPRAALHRANVRLR